MTQETLDDIYKLVGDLILGRDLILCHDPGVKSNCRVASNMIILLNIIIFTSHETLLSGLTSSYKCGFTDLCDRTVKILICQNEISYSLYTMYL